MYKSHILLGACWMFFADAMAAPLEKSEEIIDQEDQEAQIENSTPVKEPEEIINQETNQADKEEQTNQAEKSNPDLVKAVKEALSAVKKRSPQVHEDSLRVWKNFKPSSKPVHYTYRVWGRWIILWLKDEKKMAFQSEQEVGEVFKVLWREGLISQNAVVVLMVDAWSYLVYLEGSPAWENRMEKRTPQGETTPIPSSRRRSNERSI